jgi:isopentenyl diphosphate isomerase/L-lactate dehydrogenase-like FMN-dependent dehydrogenase
MFAPDSLATIFPIVLFDAEHAGGTPVSNVSNTDRSRRAFLKFLASSPLFAASPGLAVQAVNDYVISKPEEAINLLEFEAAARKALPPGHWGYLTTGADDDETLKANREGFSHYGLRPRRLVDISRVDTSIELFGTKWDSPIALAPVGTIFHPEGAYAVARAAQKHKTLHVLGGVQEGVRPIDEVMKARGGPVWYQLYASQQFDTTMQTVRRVESAGAPVLVWTVDTLAGRNLETVQRLRRLDTRQCMNCHMTEPRGGEPGRAGRNTLTWDTLRRIKDGTKMKVVVKGIETAEDAELCVQYGADGVIVSNHGGRSTESGRGTIDCLAEVVQAVRNRIPVLIDGGFRRGTDVYKAIALGARAICIGRPYLWGVAAFGQPGVESVLEIINREFTLAMAQCGKRSIAEVGPSSIVRLSG